MHIESDYSLKHLNSFGIEAKAKYFVEVKSLQDLKTVLLLDGYPEKFILGGGSNMLIKHDINALVILLSLKGIEKVEENDTHIWLNVAAGENWHQFVMYCVNHNYGGIENLALIPGNVGTAPVQNIGAYGVELKDSFVSCHVMNRSTGEEAELSKTECKLGYRDSIFKNEARDKYIITSVVFKLTTKAHNLNISYGSLKGLLEEKNIHDPSLKEIANAVIQIREEKLPDPKKIGNSGSFFKNPVVSKKVLERLQEDHSDIPFYILNDEEVKIPAGWLIEQSGFKGKRFGHAGIHDRQALVLVNHGDASGDEIWKVALKIQEKVLQDFNIELQPEVNIIS